MTGWLTLLNLVLGLANKLTEFLSRERDRKAGKDQIRAENAAAGAELKKEMEDAESRGPHSVSDAAGRLRNGKF